jgi:hypothetical protein
MLFQFLVVYVYLVLSFIPSLFYMYLDILHLSWFPTGRTDATMLLRFSCYFTCPLYMLVSDKSAAFWVVSDTHFLYSVRVLVF